jgi:hypothetical protein
VVLVAGGALTSQRSLVPEVGIFVFLMALDGLLEAVDALHAGRNTVDIAGGRAYRGCGMAVAMEGCGFKSDEQLDVARTGWKCSRIGRV